jgi:hypothetical protein
VGTVGVHNKLWAVTAYCLDLPLASAHPANDLALESSH